jgi:hypothetical protein
MEQNPYKLLWKRLMTPFASEETNHEQKFMRERFLAIFIKVVESNPMMDFSALNLFSLQELNICKILMKGTFEREFLPFFTKDLFLKDRKKISWFKRKIIERGKHARITNKMLAHQFNRIKLAVLLKLDVISTMRRKKNGYDPRSIYRSYLRITGLNRYFKAMQKIGDKFSNRVEKDFSELYCLTLVQGDDIDAKIY